MGPSWWLLSIPTLLESAMHTIAWQIVTRSSTSMDAEVVSMLLEVAEMEQSCMTWLLRDTVR